MLSTILLLLSVRSIAAFNYGKISGRSIHKVIHRGVRLSLTQNKNELAKQALSDYIEKIKDKPLSYHNHPDIFAEGTGSYLKVTCKDNYYNHVWRRLVWDASIHKYTAKIDLSRDTDIRVGFAPSKAAVSYGWYFCLKNGSIFSQDEDNYNYTAYTSGCKVGDTITCIYRASTGKISYEKNGVSLGVAYSNVKEEDIAPAVELFNDKDSLTLSAISLKY